MTSTGYERVVITGLGAVSGCGIGCGPLWEHLAGGRTAIRPTRLAFGSQEFNIAAAMVPGYIPAAYFSTSSLALADPFAQYAAIAAREAMHDSGLNTPLPEPHRCGVVLGSGEGGGQTREEASIRMFHLGKRLHPMTVPRINHQASVALVSAEYGITGPGFAIATGCVSAAQAIAQAWMMIRMGMIDMAITGGSDASICFGLVSGFDALHIVSKEPCRPFSIERGGMSLGEGAGIVIVETLSSARKRGAHIYAELAGAGMTSDAINSLHPTIEGPAQAMEAALHGAGMAATDIGYINAHGTGTLANDAAEASAINKVFNGAPPPVSSTKSIHGHTLGAAGGLELVATLLAMRHQVLPPTVNFTGPDPGCALDCIPNHPREHCFTAALSNSFAFGGLNVVLAIKKWDL